MNPEENNFKFVSITDKTSYDEYIETIDFPPLVQSWSYGDWQKQMNRTVNRYQLRDENKILASCQIIICPLPYHQKYLYIPHGPIIKEPLSLNQEIFLLSEIEKIGKKEKVMFIRIDPWPQNIDFLKHKQWQKAPLESYRSSYFQPRFEWVLDLKQSPDELLSQMRPHNRYYIKQAEHKGIIVEKILGKEIFNYLDVFYKLMLETSERGKFSLHPYLYYESLFKNEANLDLELFITKYENEILAINVVFYFGNVANWVFGASSDKYRQLNPTYLAQWQSILTAQEKKCTSYSFGGVYNSDYPHIYKDYSKVTDYKKRYGGKYLNYSESYILTIDKMATFFYHGRKKIKSFLHS